MIDLKDLRCFVAVYDSGGFARAAQAMHLTQSSISTRIRNLEKELGGPLFVRLHKSIVPTAKGELAYKYAKDVIARADSGAAAIRKSEAA